VTPLSSPRTGFRVAGLLEATPETVSEHRVALAELRPGVNAHEDAFVKLGADGTPEWVISRGCAHAGGRLELEPDRRSAVCPLHGWCLDLDGLRYTNGLGTKQPVPFEVEGGELRYRLERHRLERPDALRTPVSEPIEVRFLAHACVAIECGGFRLVTDPWLIGPCFTTGWWHLHPPKNDALELLAGANAVFLSHNHPDHTHLETLAHVSPDVEILVPDFESRSAEVSARALGLSPHALAFNTVFSHPDAPFSIAVLLAGSGRDDSGLLIFAGDRKILLAADSRALNHFVLPHDVDVVFDSFAGGASGYPLCFENYDLEERRVISRRHADAVRHHVERVVETTRPRAFVPYAGYFRVARAEDSLIGDHNVSNSVEEIAETVAAVAPETRFIDPRHDDRIRIAADRSITVDRVDAPALYTVGPDYVAPYVRALEEEAAGFHADELVGYFEHSEFQDDLILYVLPTDQSFVPQGEGVRVDFSGPKPVVELRAPDALQAEYQSAEPGPLRRLEIRARREPLAHVVREQLAWEELSIGFQCRVHRKPDLYNAHFWFHFTNRYIGSLRDRPEREGR